MKAAVLRKAKDISFEERPEPVAKRGEVLIRVRSVGVCGSDVHYYLDGRIGDYVVRKPLILGHEISGEIVELGEGVEGFNRGDKVAVEPGLPCRRCQICKAGRYNLCKEVRFCGTPPYDGAYAEFIAWPADFAHHLPPQADFDDGVLVEPLAVGMHALERGRVKASDRVAILGSGPIGLVTLIGARASKALVKLSTDLVKERLEKAKELGAELALNPKETDLVQKMKDEELDVVFDCAGAVETVQQAVDLVRPGGRVVIVGFPRGKSIPIDTARAIRKELDILPILRFKDNHQAALSVLERELETLRKLVTHHFPLDSLVEAFKLVESLKDGVVKVIIRI